MKKNRFTIIELLVVISIIMLLAGLLLPVLIRAKSKAMENSCMSNMRQVQLALAMYSVNNNSYYPLELTENNPHPELLSALDADKNSLRKAFYCPQAFATEEFAQSTGKYAPLNDKDTIINTDDNWTAGNISYVYWSFKDNKGRTGVGTGGGTLYNNSTQWRPVYATDPYGFYPRGLTGDKRYSSPTYPYAALGVPNLPYPAASTSEIYVLTDFFRMSAPFPHMRKHLGGLNTIYLDGHVSNVVETPKVVYR